MEDLIRRYKMAFYNRCMTEYEYRVNRERFCPDVDYVPACSLRGQMVVSHEDSNSIENREVYNTWMSLNINGNRPIFNRIIDPIDYSGEYFYFCHTEEEDKLFFVYNPFINENEANVLFIKIDMSRLMSYDIFMTPYTDESLSRFDNTAFSNIRLIHEQQSSILVSGLDEISLTSSQFDLHNNSESLSRGNNSSETTQNEEIMTPERYIRCHDYHCKSLEPMIIGDMAERFTDIVNNKLKELNIL